MLLKNEVSEPGLSEFWLLGASPCFATAEENQVDQEAEMERIGK